MHAIIGLPGGFRSEAVLLAIGVNRMRLAIAGCLDTVDCQLVQNQWISENGDPIEVEALWPAESIDMATLAIELFPQRRAAG